VLNDVDPIQNVKAWLGEMIHKQSQSRRAMASLAMLVSWEIWQEKNTHIIWNNISTANMTVSKIKGMSRFGAWPVQKL
jgi:hypothetical protein